MSDLMREVLVVGIGNILMQDDGVGVHLISKLKEEPIPSYIELMDGGTGGFELIDLMEGYKKIFVLDAVDFGAEAGSIVVFTPDKVIDKSFNSRHSLHGYNLMTILSVAHAIGKRFNIKVVGIQPKSTNIGNMLTDTVRSIVPNAIEIIKREII